MVTVLWARHGQNVANLTRTFSYRVYDRELTELGRQQACDLAGLLVVPGAERIGRVICSPLRRARQTAEIVGQRLGLRVAGEFDDLRELNVGALDGRSDPAAWDIYDSVLAAWQAGDTSARFPGGEDRAELSARLRQALATLALSSDGSATLAVAHGANLRAALPDLTGEPDPGSDLPTGGFADLDVDISGPVPVVRLVRWP